MYKILVFMILCLFLSGCATTESLKKESGQALLDHYANILRNLRSQPGLLGDIFTEAMPRFNNPVNLKKLLSMIDAEE